MKIELVLYLFVLLRNDKKNQHKMKMRNVLLLVRRGFNK